MTRKRKSEEDAMVMAIGHYFNLQYPGGLVHHSPNENPGNTIVQKMIAYNNKMRKMHRQVGFPDLMFLYKGKYLFMEVKTGKGVVSNNQNNVRRLIESNGGEWIVCRSIQEAIQVLDNEFKALR